MGKNVVVESNGKVKKKKKNCCCSCLVSFLIFSLVLVLALGGVGYYFGDKYSKQYLDMGLFETFGVVGDILRDGKEKDVVTNGYTSADKDGFVNELKKQLFLKQDVQIDIDEIFNDLGLSETPAKNTLLKNAMEKLNISNFNAAANEKMDVDGSSGGSAPDGENPPSEGESAGNLIFDLIGKLMTRGNIDLVSLKNYQSSPESYRLTITDRQLAAFMDLIITKVLSSESMKSMFIDYGIDNVNNYIKLKQMQFNSEAWVVDGETKDNVPTVSLTVGLKTEDLAKALVPKLLPSQVSNFSGVASWLVGVILPKDTFLTVKMALAPNSDVKIRYNNLSDEKLDKVFTVINKFTDKDVKEVINGFVADYAGAYLAVLNDMGILDGMQNGSITIDLFQLVIDLAKLNEGKPEEQHLKSADIIKTLSLVIGSSYSEGMKETVDYDFRYDYKDNEGKIHYSKTPISDMTKVEYKDELLKEVASKYLINTTGADGIENTADDITFDKLMAMFGIGEATAETTDLMSLFDAKRVREILHKNPEDVSVKLTDKMLGAIIDAQIGTIFNSGSLSTFNLTVEAISIREEVFAANGAKHHLLTLYASIATGGLFDSMGDVGGILKNMFEEKILLSVTLDITMQKVLGEETRRPGEISFNDVLPKDTAEMLNLISKFGVKLSVEDILTQVETSISNVLNTMNNFIPGLSLGESTIILPGLFDVMSDLVFTEVNEEGVKEVVVSGSEISSVLDSLIRSDEEGFETELVTNPAKDNYNEFMADVKDKFYIADDVPLTTFEDLMNNVINAGGFDQNKFNLNKLKTDNRLASELTPIIKDSELAAIMKEKMGGNASFGSMLGIKSLSIKVSEEGGIKKEILELIIKMNVGDIMGAENAKFLPVNSLYIVASIDLGNVIAGETKNRYDAKILLNDMTDEEFATINKMINHLNGGSFSLLEKQKEIGEIIYDQFATIENSLGGAIEFVNGGVKMTSFYDFLAKALGKENLTGEVIKSAIQGLYTGSSNYNYDENNIIYNPIASAPVIAFTLTDKELGASMNKTFVDTGSNLDLAQVTIFAGNRTGEEDAWLNGFNGNINKNSNYISLTFRVGLDFETANSIANFIPDEIYATIVLKYEAGIGFTQEFFRINEMTALTQDALLDIIGQTQTSISNVIDKSLEVLNIYKNPQFNELSDKTQGIGSMTFSLI